MTDAQEASDAADPYDLIRFVQAQEDTYEQALSEVRRGRKRSHWMWFIFPQFAGLGFSSTSVHYSIKSVAEAEAYLKHPVLGPRLVRCVEAALALERLTAHEIFGPPDDLKLRSCATLFAHVSQPGSVFERLLQKYFDGQRDEMTLELIAASRQPVTPGAPQATVHFTTSKYSASASMFLMNRLVSTCSLPRASMPVMRLARE